MRNQDRTNSIMTETINLESMYMEKDGGRVDVDVGGITFLGLRLPCVIRIDPQKEKMESLGGEEEEGQKGRVVSGLRCLGLHSHSISSDNPLTMSQQNEGNTPLFLPHQDCTYHAILTTIHRFQFSNLISIYLFMIIFNCFVVV